MFHKCSPREGALRPQPLHWLWPCQYGWMWGISRWRRKRDKFFTWGDAAPRKALFRTGGVSYSQTLERAEKGERKNLEGKVPLCRLASAYFCAFSWIKICLKVSLLVWWPWDSSWEMWNSIWNWNWCSRAVNLIFVQAPRFTSLRRGFYAFCHS